MNHKVTIRTAGYRHGAELLDLRHYNSIDHQMRRQYHIMMAAKSAARKLKKAARNQRGRDSPRRPPDPHDPVRTR